MSTQEHEAAADVTDEELAAMGRVVEKFVPPGHFWPKLVAEIKRRRMEAIDADHEWAQWFEKWRATLDTFSSLRMEDAAALADAVREARKIAGCVSCEDHAALICNPCAAKGKADAVRVAREDEREACARLHENIDPACDHERLAGNPGSAAMGAIVKYRDAIRGRSKWADRKRVGEGDATPGPEPARAFQRRRALGVEWFEEVPATPPKKGRD